MASQNQTSKKKTSNYISSLNNEEIQSMVTTSKQTMAKRIESRGATPENQRKISISPNDLKNVQFNPYYALVCSQLISQNILTVSETSDSSEMEIGGRE